MSSAPTGQSQLPSPWAPFQKIKTYEIPERVFEQYNTAEVGTMMGLFAELHHAWIAIDSSLYLWDYTHPNPDQTELIGFEELNEEIIAVQLVRPRAGVFVATVTHLLVVATADNLHLIGLASSKSSAGVTSVELYQTGMHVSVKGLEVKCIAGSPKTGRIFLGSGVTNDVYEITYQQEEKWFSSKCGKICQTDSGLTSSFSKSFSLPAVPILFGTPSGKPETVVQIVIDDSRSLLYTLSSKSTIRVFHIKPGQSLPLLITKTTKELMTVIGHMMNRPRTHLLAADQKLASLSAISATESSRLNLMVTTSTGVRIFLSATSGAYYGGYSNDSNSTPTSMQPYHVKFPPPALDESSAAAPAAPSSQQLAAYQVTPQINTTSSSLITSRIVRRYAPGYFFCFVHTQDEAGNVVGPDSLFLSAPDTGRIAQSLEPGQIRQFMESSQWMSLTGRTEDVGLVTAPFSAAKAPAGFGNELAVQFDQTASEVAILTNTGIHTIRRRRLVDIFAAAIRSNEGFEETITKFIRLYGRSETCAAAIAVACGQSKDVTADARVANITDPDVIELARRAFIEHGGRPTLNENNEPGPVGSSVDNVRPSPRAEGLMLYVSRLVRSVWSKTLLTESSTSNGGLKVVPTVAISKLQSVQHDLTHLKEFLDANKSFIEGLDGPEALRGAASRQDEITLQGEHRALNSLVKAIGNIIEGIAFVMVLFDDPVEELVLTLSDESRQRARELTYEHLFCTTNGQNLAKELVKAIVNRSIARGSNVDTVAEALRRRCGSFCSADDVVIFKAQEQLKRASEAGADSSSGRSLLNDSLKLFQKVASSLSSEHLAKAVEQYIAMSFYAGTSTSCNSLSFTNCMSRCHQASTYGCYRA
jgi:nuclear pore complex protein Nup155